MSLEIYGYKCRKCGQLHYPYRMVCKKCHGLEHSDFDPVPLPKKGKLLTFSRLHTLPGDFNVPTIQLGIVELENGIRITGQVHIDNPKSGMAVTSKVEVVREGEFKKHRGVVFYAA